MLYLLCLGVSTTTTPLRGALLHGVRWSCGRASVEGTGVRNHPLLFRNLGNFIHPTLPMSFRRDTKSRCSLLSGGCARGSKRPHARKWKKPVSDSVHLVELVISISKLTILPPSLAVISCKGSISSSIKQNYEEKITRFLSHHKTPDNYFDNISITRNEYIHGQPL